MFVICMHFVFLGANIYTYSEWFRKLYPLHVYICARQSLTYTCTHAHALLTYTCTHAHALRIYLQCDGRPSQSCTHTHIHTYISMCARTKAHLHSDSSPRQIRPLREVVGEGDGACATQCVAAALLHSSEWHDASEYYDGCMVCVCLYVYLHVGVGVGVQMFHVYLRVYVFVSFTHCCILASATISLRF
jgi:hypothetical protein